MFSVYFTLLVNGPFGTNDEVNSTKLHSDVLIPAATRFSYLDSTHNPLAWNVHPGRLSNKD